MKGSTLLKSLSRRRVLRGMLSGSAVTLGLPLLNCFLNGNGTAMASGGADAGAFRHLVLGSGHGFAKVFVPKTIGAHYDPARRDRGAGAGARACEPLHQLQRAARCSAEPVSLHRLGHPCVPERRR